MAVRPFCIAALLLAATSPAQAEPRAPTDQWIVNFDDAQCVAQRSYGSKEKPLALVIKEPPFGNVIQLAVVRPRGPSQPAQYEGQLAFDGAKPMKVSVLRFEPKNAKATTYLFNVPKDQFGPVTSARTLTIGAGTVDEVFNLSGMDSLLKVMDDCVSDLRRAWNINSDGVGIRSSVQGAEGKLTGFFTADDYPEAAIQAEQSGTVEVSVLVDELGRVADCAIISTSASAVLDGQTCALLRARAKFKPGVGSDGKPVKSAFRQNIRWRIQ